MICTNRFSGRHEWFADHLRQPPVFLSRLDEHLCNSSALTKAGPQAASCDQTSRSHQRARVVFMMKVAAILNLHVSHTQSFGGHFPEFVLVCRADLECEVRDTNEVQNPGRITVNSDHGGETRV